VQLYPKNDLLIFTHTDRLLSDEFKELYKNEKSFYSKILNDKELIIEQIPYKEQFIERLAYEQGLKVVQKFH